MLPYLSLNPQVLEHLSVICCSYISLKYVCKLKLIRLKYFLLFQGEMLLWSLICYLYTILTSESFSCHQQYVPSALILRLMLRTVHVIMPHYDQSQYQDSVITQSIYYSYHTLHQLLATLYPLNQAPFKLNGYGQSIWSICVFVCLSTHLYGGEQTK